MRYFIGNNFVMALVLFAGLGCFDGDGRPDMPGLSVRKFDSGVDGNSINPSVKGIDKFLVDDSD
jgi:hypothetical protein